MPSPETMSSDVAACLAALTSGQIDAGLALFERLVDEQGLDSRHLRQLVIAVHDLALKTPGDDPSRERLLETTTIGYEAWFEAFGDDPRAGTMHYAYAELMYKTQRFDEAYAHYTTVVQDHQDLKHASFCADSAVAAAEAVVGLQVKDGSRPLDPSPGATIWEENLVAAVDQALTLDPERRDGASMAYKAGYVLYETGEHERAIDWFQDVMDRDPTTPEARLASHLIMDSYAKHEDWLGLEEWALAFHRDGAIGDDSDREQAWAIAGRAGRAALEADGDADGWLAWIDRYGDDPEVVAAAAAALRAEGRDAEADALEAP